MSKTKEKKTSNTTQTKKALRQTELPKITLEEALRVPKAIWDQFAGNPTQPLFVADAVGISPTSSNWRSLSGAAIAYGLTDGGYNSKEISLTDLGRRIVSPIEENDDKLAIFEAAQQPSISKKFYEKYGNSNKLPLPNIAENLLISWGVPKEDAPNAFKLIKQNGEFSGIIVEIKGNQYVNLSPAKVNSNVREGTREEVLEESSEIEIPSSLLESMNITTSEKDRSSCKEIIEETDKKVFISHGKNKQVVEQLKQLLVFGMFEPIVSVERETTAISVPDKVFNDMRMCGAGIIHIEGERTLLDKDGQEHNLINENVLIEIGAAIALFKTKVILLCKKGTKLPSNLQGLYRCEYEGEQLDYQATMKLLKTFSEFRNS